MFTVAPDFATAKDDFQFMLLELFERQDGEAMLGELIFMEKLDEQGEGEAIASSLEFTQSWLKELAIEFEVVNHALE